MWIILVIVAFELTTVIAVVGLLIQSTWFPLAQRYPRKNVLEPSTRRNFQSFNIGVLGLGYSVHVIVDDEHLHLLPSAILGFFKCSKISIPWDDIVLAKKQPIFRWLRSCELGKFKIVGPAWCFKLAGT